MTRQAKRGNFSGKKPTHQITQSTNTEDSFKKIPSNSKREEFQIYCGKVNGRSCSEGRE